MKAFGRSGQVIGKANIDYQLWHLHYTTIMSLWSIQMKIPYANAQVMYHTTTIAGKKSNTMQTSASTSAVAVFLYGTMRTVETHIKIPFAVLE
jgi:hypothetical protein